MQVYILLLLSVSGIDSNKQKYQLSRPIAQVLCVQSNNVLLRTRHHFVISHIFQVYICKAVTGLATFLARIVIYLMLIRRAGT